MAKKRTARAVLRKASTGCHGHFSGHEAKLFTSEDPNLSSLLLRYTGSCLCEEEHDERGAWRS